jgi:hypothetical protein
MNSELRILRFLANDKIAILRWETQDVNWYNVPHRTEGPSVIQYSSEGRLVFKEWSIEGRLHREDAPARIEYENGRVMVFTYALDGITYREEMYNIYMDLIRRIRKDRNLALVNLKHECEYIQKVANDVIQSITL